MQGNQRKAYNILIVNDEYAKKMIGEAVDLGSRDNVTIAICGFG